MRHGWAIALDGGPVLLPVETAYAAVQGAAMKVWRGEARFLDLLKADPDVRPHLTDEELEELFDLGYHFKHVDTIFNRVFGQG